ncbi:FMN-binding negative transcriptional regulator [Alkalimonas amylolytica]|uniref:Negative transcriptional regulator, PaiB family n=1 Tax=Alkalimonas amylolytica TaxID=152573 RepID=A0A1H4BHA9_ALKAM|nr:FMN-binding negative transcriptional regulator [Alkalimonas amylolytica]SEA47434.1 negative transcriptional regulator, PaiB family [Alkalimonas amylolytica]
MLYCPPTLAFSGPHAMHDFIEQHSFAAMTTHPFFCSHLPWLLKRDEGEQGVLYAHLARNNPHADNLQGKQVLICFSGPHAYISPSWYQSTRAVPTWNYAVVQVLGQAELLDESQTLALLEQQIAHYEPEPAAALAKMPEHYRQQLAKAIVGIRVPIAQLAGKLKLGQQRSAADQQAVFAALQQSEDWQARALAKWMLQHATGTGEKEAVD